MEEASTRSSSEVRVVLFAILVLVLGVGGLVYWQINAGIPVAGSTPAPEAVEPFDASEVLDPIVKRISDGDGARAKLIMELESLRAQVEKAQTDAVAAESRSRKILDDFELNTAGVGAELKSEVTSLVQANASMQAQIKELRIRNESLEMQIEDLYDAAEAADVEVEEPNIVAGIAIDEPELEIMTTEEEPEVLAPIARDPNVVDGKVMSNVRVVDVKEEIEYVILDVGEEDGVRPQMIFKVLSEGQVTATLRAKDVRPDLTGAVVEDLADRGVFPQAGDRAILASGAH